MKIISRSFALLLAVIMLVSCGIPMSAFTQDNNIKTGSLDGGNDRYTYYKDTHHLVIDSRNKLFTEFGYHAHFHESCDDKGAVCGYIRNDADELLTVNEFKSIKSVCINNGVTMIDSDPFWYLKGSLEEVTIPKSIKRILAGTFSNNTNLKVVNFGGTEEEWNAVKIDRNNDYLKNAKINFNVKVDESSVKKYKDTLYRTEIINDKISVTLDYYTGLTTIKGTGKLLMSQYECGNFAACIDDLFMESIGDGCVYPFVDKVVVGEGITSIGTGVLKETSASTISLPKTLKSISKNAFKCEKEKYRHITKVYYNGSASEWDNISISKVGNENLLDAELIFADKATAKDITASLSTTYYNYDGKSHTPAVTVKNTAGKTLVRNKDYKLTYTAGRTKVGKYSVKITLMGNYSGSKTLAFYIRPKSTKITRITPKSKGFTVWWNKNTTQSTGYQIQLSTASDMKNAKTITVAKNTNYGKSVTGRLANKKYYVRIRVYTKVNYNGKSVNVYSPWSATKAVTTKK